MKLKVTSIWQWFNQWRRRGMPFRLVVLLLIGLGPFIEWNMTDQHIPLINELVWTACQAIRYSSEPRVTSTLLRGYKADANRKLQKQLHAAVTNQKINLNATELDELHKLPSKANFTILFTTAKRHNLLARDATLRRLNRDMYALAVGTTALRYDNQWREIKSMLYQKPDLTKWATWRSNIAIFNYLFKLILPLPIHLALLWGIIFFTLSFVISGGSKLRWVRNSTAIIIPLVIVILLVKLPLLKWAFNGLFNSYHSRKMVRVCNLIYLSSLTVALTIYGIRLKEKLLYSKKEQWVTISLLIIVGFMLLFPFGFYLRYWPLFDILIRPWNINLNCLILSSSKLILPLAAIGAIVLSWGIMLSNRQFGLKKIKYIDVSIAEFSRYLAWALGGIILFHRWVINFFTKTDIFQFNCPRNIVHLDQNIALLVIAILIGLSLPYFKKMNKVTLSVNSAMLLAMLVIIVQCSLS